jgi:hypothetical protein
VVFLASDTRKRREMKVRRYLASDPGISLLLAAINLEWTVCRAVRFLSQSPNSDLRARIRRCRGLNDYKDLWKAEIADVGRHQSLAEIVRNWPSVRQGFDARHTLAHGQDRCTRNMAEPHVGALLKAVELIDDYCGSLGIRLHDRMLVRRKRA